MRKRIFAGMAMLTTISLLVAAVLLCFVYYRQMSAAVRGEVRERADMLAGAALGDDYAAVSLPDMRITIIAPDGTVLYDDDYDSATMQNHADRAEVIAAMRSGVGESKRYSDTLGEETYYYALHMTDGRVLRVAKTTSSIWGVFGASLPAVIVVVLALVLVGYIMAGRLTKRIVSPLNSIGAGGDMSLLYDELAPFLRTIAEQRERIDRQMQIFKERSDTVDVIMGSMREGMIIVDGEGGVLSINHSAAAFFNIQQAQSGRNILELMRDVELISRMRAALGGQRGELDIERGGKTYRALFSPVADIGAIILFLDVTDKVKSDALRREFSANVSHELKTPLTTILGNAEMLLGGMVKDADAPVFYGKIKNEAERLIRLIEDIIMISRLDEGAGFERWESVALDAIAAEAIDALRQAAEQAAVSVTLTGSAAMNANRSQLYELFYNLVDNAIKYNRPDGSVHVELSQTSTRTVITVSDTGIGIPRQAQGRIFERFYRADKSRSKKTGGTGLGLAIVKHIVLSQGGKIHLESESGKGTIITIEYRQ